MMNTSTKKFVAVGAGIIGLVLVSCTLTGCDDWFKDKKKAQPSTGAPQTPLPPDPGEAGKATLAGIDSNNDGVRDDIERYIALTYPDSAKTRAALTQYAKVMQGAILDASSKELSLKHADEHEKASECMESALGFDTYSNTRKDLKPIILNTDARNNAYFMYDDQLGGEVFPLSNQGIAACNFDVTSLPN